MRSPAQHRRSPKRKVDYGKEHASSTPVNEILEQRARDLAKSPKASKAAALTRSLITFSAGGKQIGVETPFVLEVGPAPPYAAVPRSPQILLGVCTYKGQVLPLFDLMEILHLPPDGERGGTLLVLGDGQAELGFLVDEVQPSTSIPETSILRQPRASDDTVDVVHGMTREGLLIVDGPTLMTHYSLFI